MIYRNSQRVQARNAHVWFGTREYLQLSPYLIASQEEGGPTFGGEEERRFTLVRLRSPHDTYFYAHSFAPAYGRARATRIDKKLSALCRILRILVSTFSVHIGQFLHYCPMPLIQKISLYFIGM